jgi:hypothetical protein
MGRGQNITISSICTGRKSLEDLLQGPVGDLREVAPDEETTNKVFSGSIAGVGVIVKPEHGLCKEPLRAEISPGKELARERAAYLIAQALGVRAPVVVIRRVEGQGPCSVQELVAPEYQPRDAQGCSASEYSRRLRSIALLDAVIGNMDRHVENIRIDTDQTVYPIDHGLAFPEEAVSSKRRYSANYEALEANREEPLSEQEIKTLKKMRADSSLRRALDETELSPSSITKTWVRIDALITAGHLPYNVSLFVREGTF